MMCHSQAFQQPSVKIWTINSLGFKAYFIVANLLISSNMMGEIYKQKKRTLDSLFPVSLKNVAVLLMAIATVGAIGASVVTTAFAQSFCCHPNQGAPGQNFGGPNR